MALIRSLDLLDLIVIPDDEDKSESKNRINIINEQRSAALRDGRWGSSRANPIVLGDSPHLSIKPAPALQPPPTFLRLPPRPVGELPRSDPSLNIRSRKTYGPIQQPFRLRPHKIQNDLKQSFNLVSGPIRKIPREHYRKLKSEKIKFEASLIPFLCRTPEWLARNGHKPRRTAQAGKSYGPCWLEDYIPTTMPLSPIRFRDVDALPRWFGPLNYTSIHFNGGRLPTTSLEFFQLCFVPVEPGDMEIWVKYREIEEEIWTEGLDRHEGFKAVIWGLHGLAFGQKEAAEVRVRQMGNVMERWTEDRAVVPFVGRDYFMWGCCQ